ncbi:MAG: TIGR03790 family protein [Planctomycetia bacterium]|nr:TIGR03790 family protein [Planctomycetia bacterium]
MKNVLLCVAALWGTVVYAELLPKEVAVIATAGSDVSLDIARHYVLSRKLPPRNVFLLKQAYGSRITREQWNQEVRPQLKQWLATRPDVRCLVCCWDVPLVIDGYTPQAPEVAGRLAFLTENRKKYVEKARRVFAAMDSIPPNEEVTKKSAERTIPDDITVVDLGKRMEESLREVQKRVAPLPKESRTESLKKIQILLQISGGLRGFYAILNQRTPNPETPQGAMIQQQLQRIRVLLSSKMSNVFSLETLPESTSRDAEILRLMDQIAGILGSMQWIDGQLEITRKNESVASFDSELSAIFEESTPLIRWIPNYRSHLAPGLITGDMEASGEKSQDTLPGLEEATVAGMRVPVPRRPVMMVARLEAPKPEIVIRMIDDSVETEQKGLDGAIYLDARNPRPEGKLAMGSYEKMDQSLCDLAARLKEHTKLNVKLDTAEPLFQKKDCPDPAALYCGWYSLANYVDAMPFSKGAVGYHTASLEASSLREGNAWCPQLLSHGVDATLGPTFEPYLSAFPEPDEFYSLVLTGKFTMIECYYFTKPFNSWAMTYVGDPLYTPYRNRPQLTPEQLPETLKKFFGVSQ